METKHTKGIFSDGHIGWKIDKRDTNGVKGFEIHFSDDGECITDHVYEFADAKLIANAPDLLEALINANNVLKMASLIDKSNTCEEAQLLCEKVLKNTLT